MARTWDDLRGSEFFNWFHISEVGRVPGASPGETTIACKPGSFQDAIDLRFTVDASGTLGSAMLTLDRGWMAGERDAPFALDIVKSFLQEVAGSDPVLGALARQMEGQLPNLPGVISRVGVASAPAAPPPFPEALAVYRDEASEARLAGREGVIVLRNMPGERETFSVEWTANAAPSVARFDEPSPAPPMPMPAPGGGYAPPPGRFPFRPPRTLPNWSADDLGAEKRPWWKFWRR